MIVTKTAAEIRVGDVMSNNGATVEDVQPSHHGERVYVFLRHEDGTSTSETVDAAKPVNVYVVGDPVTFERVMVDGVYEYRASNGYVIRPHVGSAYRWLAAGMLFFKLKAAKDYVRGLAAPTTPDNVTERQQLARIIEEATGDDYVTTTEAYAVVEWCRGWATESDWGMEEDDFEDYLRGLADVDVLKECDALIDGGLAFVLADVRCCLNQREDGEDVSRVMNENNRAGSWGALPADGIDAALDAQDEVQALTSLYARRRRETFELLVSAFGSINVGEEVGTWRARAHGMMDAYCAAFGVDPETTHEDVSAALTARAERSGLND